MTNEIRRSNWSRFFKKFNSANQYRPTKLNVRQSGSDDNSIPVESFMGIALRKKGRFIDGIQFFNGGWSPDKVAEPIATVVNPSRVWIEKDQDGRDSRLQIRSDDGTEALLELRGEKQSEQEQSLVEKVAYSMFEHRGCCHGDDMSDWYEAENLVRQAESNLAG